MAISLPERGAILLGGRLGKAYFFSETSGEMTSSSYYMPRLPEWVTGFNAEKLPDKSFGQKWERTLPPTARTFSGPDDAPWEGGGLGLGRTFPHPVTGGETGPRGKYWEAFAGTPFAIDYELAFARAAVEGERLGGRGVTDLLAISISPTGAIGHRFGVYSREAEDALVRTDRALGAFLAWLDGRLGPGGSLVVLTADHGASPPPEQVKDLGGVRARKAAIQSAVQAALEGRFGKGEWVLALEDPSVYLDRRLIADRKLDPAEVERAAGEALLSLPGFAGYYTRTQLERGWLPPTAAARAVARSYSPARSGDVLAVPAPFAFWGETDYGGSHGSSHRYDTDVPLVLAGAAFKPGYAGSAEMVDLAATLAHVLGIAPPAACEGEVLTRILR